LSATDVVSAGASGDVPVPGDYDGDGKADVAYWHPSEGRWVVIPSTNPHLRLEQQLGASGDIPVPKDYDGDGRTDFAVYRPATGMWYIVPSASPWVRMEIQCGEPGDVPVNKPPAP
jgi:putative transposon-encoded protein